MFTHQNGTLNEGNSILQRKRIFKKLEAIDYQVREGDTAWLLLYARIVLGNENLHSPCLEGLLACILERELLF
jgi:hypothetical protein